MAVAMLSSTAHAQPSASPAKADTAEEAEEPERQATTQLGVGLAFASNAGVGRAPSSDSFGLLLEAQRNIPLTERVDIGLRFAWGLTAWDRFSEWAKAGYEAGAWTTEAYSDVYDWTRKHSGHPNTHGLRIFASFFAYIGLLFGYMVSGLLYAGAVVAPTTFLEVDATAAYNFGDKSFDPYLKGGVGLVGFIHPEYDNVRGGVGPTFGGGFRAGKLHVGATVTWSPPGAHGEPRPDASSHIYVGGLTVGVVR